MQASHFHESMAMIPVRLHPLLASIPFIILTCGCTEQRPVSAAADSVSAAARDFLIVDTHIDVPYRLFEKYENVAESTQAGDFDWPRARAGGLDVAFMSIYVPADYQQDGGAKAHADVLIDMMQRLAAESPEKFAVVASVASARSTVADDKVALALGIENGAAIEDDLANVAYFYDRGIRYITLAHSRANLIADSSYDDERPWGGLSPFGEQVVSEMNRLGIMADISHVTDEAFYDVLALSPVPVIASHSSARHFTPAWERNMSDAMIRDLAGNGGVIQINFGSSFLTAAANAWSETYRDERDALIERTGWSKDGPEIDAWQTQYRQVKPYPYASLDDVLDHIDHVVTLAGVEHVGLGSDFDGVGDSLPTGLKDVSEYPNLVAGLRKRGYTDADIEKIFGENLMRVWLAVEAYASQVTRIDH